MQIHRLPRQAEQLGTLSLFARLDVPRGGTTIGDARRQADFAKRVTQGLSESLRSPARLHGWRVQEMFAAMILGLGRVRLLTVEDEGECYFAGEEHSIRMPDFRMVTEDGEQLLVEVKNVPPDAVGDEQVLRLRDLEALERYAELTKARLMIAHYWAGGPNLWTMVDAAVLRRVGDTASLALIQAIPASELASLGDRMLATVPPLTMSLRADPRQTTTAESGGTATISFQISGVDISCAGTPIEDELEKDIAWRLMLTGSWPPTQVPRLAPDGSLASVDYVFAPVEPVEQQELQMIGTLSSMHATLYNLATLTEEGDFLALRRESEPGELAEIVPADYWESREHTLPLWQFSVQPSSRTDLTD